MDVLRITKDVPRIIMNILGIAVDFSCLFIHSLL